MIKEFFKAHEHLSFELKHEYNGWYTYIYNTGFTCDRVFEHFISDQELELLNVDFETAIMTPVINWWEQVHSKGGK